MKPVLYDWLIVGALSLGVSLAGSTIRGAARVISMTGGIVLVAVIANKLRDNRQGDLLSRIKELNEQVVKKEELQIINSQLPTLRAEQQELRVAQKKLGVVEGRLVQKQAEFQQIDQRVTNLSQQQQKLQNSIATINQQQPNLSKLEQIQSKTEQLRLESNRLKSQIDDLKAHVQNLSAQREELKDVQSELITKSRQLVERNTQVQELQTKAQGLEERAAELELLRATYDGIFSQKQNFEERINQLRPDIDRLEAEKQRILQAIQQSQQDYQRIEELRQRLSDIELQIRDKGSLLRTIERRIDRLNGIQAGLEETIAQLTQEKEQLLDDIRRLKGEIDKLRNSAEVALKSLREPLWNRLIEQKCSQIEEQQFLESFISYIHSQGLTFPRRVINAFHTSLKVQDISVLVILAGISGTGKSELPQQYANYIGAQLLTLAVQPRWDSPQDLQGFYNYVEQKFKPTDLMRGLYQYQHDRRMQDRIVIMLLDEMNLARVEYYFSDFLSKLETRRNYPTYLDIDVGSLPLLENERKLKIPNEFLFVGTMNEDETTQSLSDKVLDRANVLTFGKPQTLKLRQDHQSRNEIIKPSGYLAYSDFKSWVREPDADSQIVERVKNYLNRVNQVMEKLGHPFAHRVYQAIMQYVVNYPGVENNSEAWKFALADQFGQKLLPKLRGVMIDEAHEELDELEKIITDIGDNSLIMAFSKAREGRYGQFQYSGLVYQD